MIKVCSGFSPKGRVQYGERFLKSFDRNWPSDVALEVYVEEMFDMPRAAQRSLWDCEGAAEFMERHKYDERVHGRGQMPNWKDKERRAGYSFRHDAMKFFKQILIPRQAAKDMSDGDILIWIDGDVETFHSVPKDFIDSIMAGVDLAYLGREKTHSEIGFWAIRISDNARDFLSDIASYYTGDHFLNIPEWHSAYVWDYVRVNYDFTSNNLSTTPRGHVWTRSVLAKYMVHRKGDRKLKIR